MKKSVSIIVAVIVAAVLVSCATTNSGRPAPSNQLSRNEAVEAYNRGNAYYWEGDYDRAIADYNQAIRLDPNHYQTYFNRGWVYSYKGMNDRAIEDYNATLRIDPNDANARNNLETARRARGY
jgi:Tfp pilus assembly protein PilF